MFTLFYMKSPAMTSTAIYRSHLICKKNVDNFFKNTLSAFPPDLGYLREIKDQMQNLIKSLFT